MKKILYTALVLMTGVILMSSCETVIDPALEKVENVLAVDAWINDKPAKQIIMLTMTQSYFDNSIPPGVSGATVTVTNVSTGKVFSFKEVIGGKGAYTWTPASVTDVLGKSRDNFKLTIQANGETYESYTSMGRVHVIDSLTFTFTEKTSFFPAYNNAEFWATDPVGIGDTYWIRATKNDTLLNKPSEISVAYDAGFSNGGNFDGIQFIPPIRSSVNPFDQAQDGTFLPPYDLGESLYVEVQSISLAAFNYLTQVSVQTNRPGGFSELFSSPIANVSTNISNIKTDGKKAVGFFNVAAISGLGKKVIK